MQHNDKVQRAARLTELLKTASSPPRLERIVMPDLPDLPDCPNCGWAINACHCVPKEKPFAGYLNQLLVFKDGSVAALDRDGKQIARLQRRTLIEAFAKLAKEWGFEVDGCKFDSPWGKGWIVGEIQQFDRGDACPASSVKA